MMKLISKFDPFSGKSQSLSIGDLTIEDQDDRLVLYGQMEIPRDMSGKEKAHALKELFTKILARLETETLPEAVTKAPPTPGENPFA